MLSRVVGASQSLSFTKTDAAHHVGWSYCMNFAVEDLREAYKQAVTTGDNCAAEYLLRVMENAENTRQMVETARNAANG